MTLTNFLVGLSIGLPIMIAVGPISVLLLDQGLERGAKAASPAALGVASADLTFSIIAAVAGASVSTLLAPITGWMTLAAVGILVWLAVDLGRSSLAELRAARPSALVPAGVVPAGVMDAGGMDTSAVATTSIDVGSIDAASGSGGSVAELVRDDDEAGTSTFGHLDGTRLAATFYGLTMVNPLTIVLFASVVVAGGTGVGSAGWALGMATSSLLVHGGFVLLGGVLGTTLSPVATARLRFSAALFMAALAVHFLLAA